MAEFTQNYNLKKPAEEDFYNVKDFNDNADIVDQALKAHDDELATKETPEGAQEKADAALNSAKQYTDQEVGEVAQALTTHLAESATKVIEEYGGSSTDGYYIKWGNGLTICLKRVTVSGNIGGGGSAFTTPLPTSLTESRVRFGGFTPVEPGTAYSNISNLGNVVVSVSTTQWILRAAETNRTLNQELFLFAVGF